MNAEAYSNFVTGCLAGGLITSIATFIIFPLMSRHADKFNKSTLENVLIYLEQEERKERFFYKNSETKQHVFNLQPLIVNDIYVLKDIDDYDFVVDGEVESCLVEAAVFIYDTDKPYVKIFVGGESEEESKIVFHLKDESQVREYFD